MFQSDFSKIKYIATDLDGTLLNKMGQLPDFSKEILEEAIHKGYSLIVASGRPYHALPKQVMEIPGITYAIASNGAIVYDVANNRLLKRYLLSEEAIVKVLSLTQTDIVSYEVFIEGHAYADASYIHNPEKYGASAEAVNYVKASRIMKDDIRSFILENKNNIESMAIIVKGSPDKERITDLLTEALSDVYITSSVPQLIEISDMQCGKHSALNFIAQREGASSSEMVAFGNADNDIDMLRYAEYGFAVENADSNCLKHADFVIPSNHEEGVAKVIQQIINM